MPCIRRFPLGGFLLALLVFMAGCTHLGPGSVVRDRFSYTSAISDSWKSQMLMNLVKLRYGEPPVFLEVSSIISQYTLESQLGLNLSWFSPSSASSQTVSGTSKFTDRPTISYNLLTGERFTRSLMTPIAPSVIFSLIQAGWPVESVFRLCVQSINNLHNDSGYTLVCRDGDPEFYQLIEALGRIQKSGGIGLRVHAKGGPQGSVVVFGGKEEEGVAADRGLARNLLKLDPDANELTLAFGSVPKSDREIALLTRSMLQILGELAEAIQVPEVHVSRKKVQPTRQDLVCADQDQRPLLIIRSGLSQPSETFAAVPYRSHWFWIDDEDFPSKRLFSLLMVFFTLTEQGGKDGGPIVTIPAG